MPYKANEPRRRKIPRARYRVTNWHGADHASQWAAIGSIAGKIG